MNIDMTTAANLFLALASAAVTAAIPIVVPALLRRLHIANDADLAGKVDTAAQAAAGVAYKYALAHEGGLANIPVHDAAIAAGAKYVNAALPDTLAKLGITPESVDALVTARLGELLAKDPTVTAGAPKPTPADVPPETHAPVATK